MSKMTDHDSMIHIMISLPNQYNLIVDILEIRQLNKDDTPDKLMPNNIHENWVTDMHASLTKRRQHLMQCRHKTCIANFMSSMNLIAKRYYFYKTTINSIKRNSSIFSSPSNHNNDSDTIINQNHQEKESQHVANHSISDANKGSYRPSKIQIQIWKQKPFSKI